MRSSRGCRTTTSATSWGRRPTAARATSPARASTGSAAGSSCGMPREPCSAAWGRKRRRGRRRGERLLDEEEPAGEGGLLAGGGVAVDDAAGHRLVDGADRLADGVAGGGALGGLDPPRVLHRGADLAANSAVAQTAPLVLLDALPG